MTNQVAHVCKRFLADLAPERSFAGVAPCVNPQVILPRKRLLADAAAKQPLAGVCPFVNGDGGLKVAGVRAEATLVHPSPSHRPLPSVQPVFGIEVLASPALEAENVSLTQKGGSCEDAPNQIEHVLYFLRLGATCRPRHCHCPLITNGNAAVWEATVNVETTNSATAWHT
ncbi:unnamed protein product [Ixodes persulcatus]